MDTFQVRGGEFGNWLSNEERQRHLNLAYEAFYDLATALGIKPSDITFGGKLSIAFGSRGRGGQSAASAHFEPLLEVINLTKIHGAGCLAHEWGHAMDHLWQYPPAIPLCGLQNRMMCTIPMHIRLL